MFFGSFQEKSRKEKTMPEARDRLVRPVDVAVVFAQRRQGVLGILQDEPESASNPLGSPLGRAAAATPRVQTRVAGRGGGLGTPRSGLVRGRRNAFGSATVTRGPIGRDNTPAGSAARRGRTVLPSWYPRTPLRDITAVVRVLLEILSSDFELKSDSLLFILKCFIILLVMFF